MSEPNWKNLTLFPRAALHPAVVARADKVAGENAAQPWAVAFSGGADSLALLLTVWTHWPEQRDRLLALHFNHRLRGTDSDEDEAFCRKVCAALGVSIRVGVWLEARADMSEAQAREARLAFFAQEMSTKGATVLWTGHQKDDIAETLLMRLARGSSSAGLAAPRPVQARSGDMFFLRPLLTLTKAEIVETLRRAGAVWREDATNALGDFFRNRVRHDVVPAWRSAAENEAFSGAALTRELLEEDDTALTAWLTELMPESGYSRETLDIRTLAGRPKALLRRALRRWHPLAPLGRAGFEEVLLLCERGSGRVSAGDGVVELGAGVLRYVASDPVGAKPWRAVGLNEGVTLFLPDGTAMMLTRVTLDEALRARIFAGDVDPAREAFFVEPAGALHVRTWCAGDRYRPLGASGSGKLQDMFVNRKIPPPLRTRLPVVFQENGGIVWVPGFPPAEESKITRSNVAGLRLTYDTGTYTVTL